MDGKERRGSIRFGSLLWVVGSLALSACGEARVVQIEGRAEQLLFEDGPQSVAVGGTVRVFPPAAGWQVPGASGGALDFENGRVVLDDPLQRALGDPRAVCGEAPIGEGAFSVDEVAVEQLVLGLGGSIEDVPTFAPVTTLLFDAGEAGTRPREDLQGVIVEAVPLTWIEALEEGIGPGRLAAWAPEAGRLLEAGFLVGRVLDAFGEPVAGARLRVEPADLQERLSYPHGDLEDLGVGATDGSGLFLLVHDGRDVRTLTLTLEDASGARPHSGVLVPGRGLLLQLRPSP